MDGTSTLEIFLTQKSWASVDEAKRVGTAALPILRRFSRDEDYQKRQLTMTCVGEIGSPQGGTILANGIADENLNVALAAVRELIKKPYPSATDAVNEQLNKDQDQVLRELLALAAGWLPGDKTTETLQKIVAANDGRVSENARMALAKLGDAESRQIILQELSDPLPRTRYDALKKLIYIGDPSLARYAQRLLNDKNPALRIGNIRNPHFRRVCDQAVDTIVELLNAQVGFRVSPEKIYHDEEIAVLQGGGR
jgi:HEAT repeat protein